MARFLVYLICCIICTNSINGVLGTFVSDELKVTLNHGGVLVGRYTKSNYGRYVRAFLGIQYGKPPTGNLRFSAPVPSDPWTGERMVTQSSEYCPQLRNNIYSGSEDCLYLNVYTPLEPRTQNPLPVFLFLHGGGFTEGSGAEFDPKRFMDRDIIFVTSNYRLGALGFLSSETLDMPGNFGLKDQLLTLKWIKEHISSFGGDDNSITIYGSSAGSGSVAYLTLSETTKGLFHRSIIHSGTFYSAWGKPSPKGYAAELALEMAGYVDCGGKDSWENTTQCLRSASAEALVESANNFLEWDSIPSPVFPIVVEPEHDDAFITQLPQVTEYSNSLPMMIGFNVDEGMFLLLHHDSYNSDFEEFKNELDSHLSVAFGFGNITRESEQFVRQSMFDFYFENGTLSGKSQNLTNLFSDGVFIRGVDEHIRHRLSSEYSSADTYVFQLSQKGNIGGSYLFVDESLGTIHGDELYYLFPVAEDYLSTGIPTARDDEVTEKWLDMFYNFAAVGNPTPDDSDLPSWKPMNSYPPKSMRIGSQNMNDSLFEFIEDYPTRRMDFWRTLNPYLETPSLQRLRSSFL